jgi:hypothetical protein
LRGITSERFFEPTRVKEGQGRGVFGLEHSFGRQVGRHSDQVFNAGVNI